MGVSDTLGGISDPAPKRKSCRKAKRNIAVRQNRSQFDIKSTSKDSKASLASLDPLAAERDQLLRGYLKGAHAWLWQLQLPKRRYVQPDHQGM